MQRISLLDRRFGTLPLLSVWTNCARFLIPPGLDGLDAVILILDEIYYSYQDDLAENGPPFESFPPPHPDEYLRYQRREIWRIGSFIVFALNLELILKRRYKDLLNLVRELQQDSGALSDGLLQKRAKEIEGYKTYRDKIFAHTAFGKPYKEDNLSMQATSLMLFQASAGRITPEGVGIGGMSVTVGGQEPPNFEPLTFPKMVSDFGKHFLEWRKMFGKLCSILQASTDDEIKQAIGCEVQTIRRVGDADGDAS